MREADGAVAGGRCMCGAVDYTVHGPLRDAVICHCIDCRHWHGSSPSMVAARRELIEIRGDQLTWYAAEGKPRRGFCATCGSSMFWDADDRPTLTIAAGTLEQPTGVRIKARIYTAHAGDYEAIPHDALPQYPYGAPREVSAAPPDD